MLALLAVLAQEAPAPAIDSSGSDPIVLGVGVLLVTGLAVFIVARRARRARRSED